jgi:transcription elongation factor Elf1
VKYVYLSSQYPITDEIEINDVGIILSEQLDQEGRSEVKFLRIGKIFWLESNYFSDFVIEETGDRFELKICDRCFKLLPTGINFSGNRLKKDNIITSRPSCKSCRKKKDGVQVSRAEKKEWEAKRPQDYTSFICPICGKNSIIGITKIVLDHDHSTGKVRGWICESCNTGIGRFDDDLEIVYKAVEWLMRESDR